MAEGVQHYKEDGTLYEGETHKMPDGSLHSGKEHSDSSVKLFHMGELSEEAKEKAMKGKGKKKGKKNDRNRQRRKAEKEGRVKKGDGKELHSPSGHSKNGGRVVVQKAKDNENYWDDDRSDIKEIKKKISMSIRANKRKSMRKS